MKIGVFGLNSGPMHTADMTSHLAPLAEGLGYDSWWVGEHVVLPSPQAPPSPAPPEVAMLDPLVHLAFVAALTSHIALATGIIILPQRNPVVLAKQVASLDVVSNGRFWFGIGVGYLEAEFRAIGAPFDDRGQRTDEYDVAKGLMRYNGTQEVRPVIAFMYRRYKALQNPAVGEALRVANEALVQFGLSATPHGLTSFHN